jgi:hypothetical protein
MNVILFTIFLLIARLESRIVYNRRILGENLTQKVPKSTEVVPVPDLSASPELSCNYEIMRSFGFSGHPTPKTSPHKYCPSIADNCCTEEDAEASYTIWNTDIRFKIERYYQIFHYAIKYLFGYTPEGFLLARKFAVQPSLQCKQAANDYLAMNLNPPITQHIVNRINYSLKKISDIRRGFFCSVCDARVQTHFKDFFATTNMKTFSELYFSKEFCLTLVEETIEAAFYTVSYVYRYLNNVVTLMNCETGAVERPQIDLSNFIIEDIKACFFFKNKYFFFLCQKYCNQFNMVKVSPVLDGDLLQLKPFVDFFVKYRSEAFEYPRNNVFADGVGYEENFLVDMYPEVLRDFVFFRPSAQQSVFLDQYTTEVVPYVGMNPIPATVGSNYELTLFGWAGRLAGMAVLTLVVALTA